MSQDNEPRKIEFRLTIQQIDMLMLACEVMARQHTGNMSEAYKRLHDMLRLKRP